MLVNNLAVDDFSLMEGRCFGGRFDSDKTLK